MSKENEPPRCTREEVNLALQQASDCAAAYFGTSEEPKENGLREEMERLQEQNAELFEALRGLLSAAPMDARDYEAAPERAAAYTRAWDALAANVTEETAI